ncbi:MULTISPECIES: MFS transporter [Acidiplasma]|uniref:MFS transporter n=4 Tax=Ferroplasmaceae TaxID=90142 RepID=A0A0N8VKZ2_9ARCH|nr:MULTISPECIES: MFS transporter [Acidiplasma]KJE49996.1 MFS transporter [Acidiplasma sp. MBA-1]KPV45792.1 MFS transporter [Acidiplasma aeolicum]KQB34663.1 MFS transporter [Acidiplasma aeolicum]KQB35076.1 MFS transporter [Acidiplasma cupricumulans]
MNKLNNSKHVFLLYSIILILMAISMRSTNNMVVTTVPLFSKYILHFSYILTALVTAVIYLGTVIATSFLNPLMNARLRKKVFVFSNFLLTLFLILYYLSNSISVFIISFLIGLAYGIILPNIVTSASLYPDQTGRERLLSIYSVGLSFSLVFGPTLESYLLKIISYRTIFLFFAPIGIIGFISSFFMEFPENKRETHGKSIRHNSGLWTSILTITTYNVPFAALTVFLAIFAETRFQVSRYMAYLPFVFFFTVSFFVRIYLSIRPIKNIRYAIIIAPAITVIALILFPFLPNYDTFILVMMLLGIPHGSIFPLSTIEISRGSSIYERNAINSYFYSYNMSLFMIIPLIFAAIIPYIGFEKTFAILIIPVIISVAVIIKKFWKDDKIFGVNKSML